LAGTTATSVLSGTVTYTGGLIDTALLAAGYSQNGGDMAISMSGLTDPNTGNPEGLNIAGDGYIANANASATGLFDAVVTPEPASLALVAMAALPLMRRRRQ
jgi:MYXO-CTERM domain-containing protein